MRRVLLERSEDITVCQDRQVNQCVFLENEKVVETCGTKIAETLQFGGFIGACDKVCPDRIRRKNLPTNIR